MNTEREAAKRFGVLELIDALKADLLLCKFVKDVKFGFSGFYDDMGKLIVKTEYDIPPSSPTYYIDRHDLIEDVLHVAEKHGLTRTNDLIEDHATYFYFVFNIYDECD